MSKRTDVDALAELSDDEIDDRVRAAAERVEMRTNRAHIENRDLTPRETQLTTDDRAELEALRDAVAVKEYTSRTQQALNRAMETTPRPEQRAALADFITEVAAGRPVRVAVECRAVTTAVAGARGGVAVNGIGQPEWLYTAASIPFSPAADIRHLRPVVLRS